MIVYDFEVFKYNWLVVFYDTSAEEYIVVQDREELKKFYEKNKDKIFVGFNSKHYDSIIFRYLLTDAETPLYKISKMIIEEKGNLLKRQYKLNAIQFYNYDLMVDVYHSSLKELEGYFGKSIKETPISFELDRPLTKEELDEVILYCKRDVEATYDLLMLRINVLKNRILLLKEYGRSKREIDDTNAVICAKILGCTKQNWTDGRQPIDISIIPVEIKDKEIVDFYTHPKTPDGLYDYSLTLKKDIAGLEHILAWGGLHGAIESYHYKGKLWLVDVASYYPNMMINFNLCSRNMANPDSFKELCAKRMNAKALKNKYNKLVLTETDEVKKEEYKKLAKKYSQTTDALKPPINTTSGAMKAVFSDLYDERSNNWMCISGQLLLIDLIEHLEPYSKLIQSNTDGIVIIPYDEEKCDAEIKKWETKTGLILEKTVATQIFQKDVNNYILLDENGKIKVKGSYVSQYNIHGAWNLRTNNIIVDRAVVDYLLYNTPIEQTIVNGENDLINYQCIKKLGGMYKKIGIEVDGNVQEIDTHINRIIATSDTKYGKVKKMHNKKTTWDNVEGIPDHCIIMNDDIRELKAKDIKIDYTYYIDLAKKRICDFVLTGAELRTYRKYTKDQLWKEVERKLGRDE